MSRQGVTGEIGPVGLRAQALRLLRAAGIVRARRAGRTMHYRLDDAHVRMLLDVSREHLRHTEPEER